MIIELPKGGYAPVFRRPDVGSEILQTEVKLARKPRRVPLRLAIALASLVAIAAAAVFWRLYRQTTPIPIAVLPLENVVTIPRATSSPTASPAKLSGTFR